MPQNVKAILKRNHIVLSPVNQQPRHGNVTRMLDNTVNRRQVIHIGLRERTRRFVPHEAFVRRDFAEFALRERFRMHHPR